MQNNLVKNILPSDSLLHQFAQLKPVYKCNTLLAHQADDVFGFWDAWEKETGDVREIPYWVVVWPGAVLLARYILENQSVVSNKNILDFGCGGALVSIAAAKAGAQRVIANDIDSTALYIAQKNITANKVIVEFLDKDLLSENESILDSIHTILVADMFYEKSKSETLLPFLMNQKDKGKTVIIADGQRAYAPKDNVKLLLEETIPVNFELEGRKERVVRILEL